MGVSQLVCWGVTYHLIGVFGELIAADLGWSRPLAYGGLTTALVVTGVSSPLAGRLIDRHGGRPAWWRGRSSARSRVSGSRRPTTSWSTTPPGCAWGSRCASPSTRPRSRRSPGSAAPRPGGRSGRSRSWAGSPRPCSGRSGTRWRGVSAGGAPCTVMRPSLFSRSRSTSRFRAPGTARRAGRPPTRGTSRSRGPSVSGSWPEASMR